MSLVQVLPDGRQFKTCMDCKDRVHTQCAALLVDISPTQRACGFHVAKPEFAIPANPLPVGHWLQLS